MSLRRASKLAVVALVAAPACVVNLTDRNAPLPNGGVTGAPTDCSTIQIVGRAALGTTPEIRFVGRYDFADPARPRYDWSGNYISARFNGSEVTAGLKTIDGNDLLFEAVVDGQPIAQDGGKIRVTVDRESYPIATGLNPNVPHEVVLHRNTEVQKG